jgi:hypothetical protein
MWVYVEVYMSVLACDGATRGDAEKSKAVLLRVIASTVMYIQLSLLLIHNAS